MLPAFDIDGGIMPALARGLAVAALLSAFGSLVFQVFVLPRVPAEAARCCKPGQAALTRWSLAAALAGLLAWLVAESGDMAGAGSAVQALAAVPAVLPATDFGRLIGWQILAVLAAAALLGRHADGWRQRGALAAATAALALQAGHSHAASMYAGPSFLLASDVAHLFAAGAWLGGLLPLLLLVRDAPAKAGALAARWFSPLGKLCLVALTASALFQGWVLVGSIPGLVGTAYGWVALAKLALFGVLFGFAVFNRYRLAPALLRNDPVAAKRALVRSIGVQTGFGLAVVAAAIVLSSLPPAMHEQPVWPFPDLFTLDTVNEDPEFRNEVLGAVLALAGAAVLLVIAGVVRSRARWLGVAAAAGIAWLAVPHLSLLFVPAYPTSFYRSPTNFAATSIVQGAALFPEHCAMCHGADGRGDGPAAKGLPVPPADLTAGHLWMHSDGELFWWLTHGIEAPEGGLAMPAFANILSDDDRWRLIDYIRAHNAGVAFHASGEWPVPVQAPGFQAVCAGGRATTLADLQGGFVRLVIGAAPVTPLPGVTTVFATSDPAMQPAPATCVARDEMLPAAYGIVAGLPAADLAGTEFLIDGNGWLRALQHPAAQPGWNDPKLLAAEIGHLIANPIAAGAGASHAHMQM